MQITGEKPELIDAQVRYLKMQPIDKEIKRVADSMVLLFYRLGKDRKVDREAMMRVLGSEEDVNRLLEGARTDEERKKLLEKYKEVLLNGGWFIREDNRLRSFFCYGTYE